MSDDPQLMVGLDLDGDRFDNKMLKAGRAVTKFDGTLGKAEKRGGSLVGSIVGGAGRMGAALGGPLLMAGAVAFDKIGDAMGGCVAEAREAQVGMDRLEKTLAATDGKVGLTADEISKLSKHLSASDGLSKYSDDATLAMSTMLLKANSLGKDTFPKAAQAALDLADKFGGPEQAASALAIALDNPTKGIKMLEKAGVAFTGQQEAQILAMKKAGDQAGASALILNQVNAVYGGTAAAAAQAAGPMVMLGAKFADIQEEVGTRLIPIITQFSAFIASPAVMGAISGLATGLIDGIGGAISFLSGVFTAVQPYFDSFTRALGAAASGDAASLTAFLGGLPEPLRVAGQFVADLVTNFSQFFAAISQGGDIVGAFGHLIGDNFTSLLRVGQDMIGWIGSEGLPLLISKLGEWGAALWGWIGPQIPVVLGKLGEMAGTLFGWLIGTALPTLISKLGEWGIALWNWITPQIPVMLGKLGELASALWRWFTGDALPAIISNLGTWAKAFIDWIGPMIPPALAALGGFLVDIGKWVLTEAIPGLVGWLLGMGEALWKWIERDGPTAFVQFALWFKGVRDWVLNEGLPKLVGMLKEWGAALINWIGTDALPFIAGKLGEFGQAVWTWLTGGGLTALIGNLVQWGGALVGWIAKDAIPFVVGALLGFGQMIWDWLSGDGLSGLVGNLVTWGTALVDWVSKNALPFIGSKLAEFGQAIWNWISGAATDAATKARDIGASMVEGIKRGLDGAWQGLMNKFGELAAQLPEPLRQALGIQSPSKVMMRDGSYLVEGLIQGIEKTAPALLTAWGTLGQGLTGPQGSLAGAGAGAGGLSPAVAAGTAAVPMQITIVMQQQRDGSWQARSQNEALTLDQHLSRGR